MWQKMVQKGGEGDVDLSKYKLTSWIFSNQAKTYTIPSGIDLIYVCALFHASNQDYAIQVNNMENYTYSGFLQKVGDELYINRAHTVKSADESASITIKWLTETTLSATTTMGRHIFMFKKME